MSDNTFTAQINRVMRVGNLRVADLARWLDRPHATVRGWVNGNNIRLAPMDTADIIAALDEIEDRVKRKDGFPVPKLTSRARKAYIFKLMQEKTLAFSGTS